MSDLREKYYTELDEWIPQPTYEQWLEMRLGDCESGYESERQARLSAETKLRELQDAIIRLRIHHLHLGSAIFIQLKELREKCLELQARNKT